jgi:hypothetical protein
MLSRKLFVRFFMHGKFWSDFGAVLGVFLIPFGGGIPAGVILAKQRGLNWPATSFIYFVSDVILACAFEPLLLLFVVLARRSAFLTRFAEEYKKTLARTGFKYGLSPSPLSLIVLSFGVDPMTGRSVARAAGYGFFSGWFVAICGDMIYFALLMVSTLFLNNILGDGTTAALIVMLAMFGVPLLIQRWKTSRST